MNFLDMVKCDLFYQSCLSGLETKSLPSELEFFPTWEMLSGMHVGALPL